ncbi:hypothetical protein VTK26DRAFT_6944 [Humicola hyalothermophila]
MSLSAQKETELSIWASLKPTLPIPQEKDEAIKLLSLDGGSIQEGYGFLLVLHAIMTRLKESQGLTEVPEPYRYFDMIAGTGMGGLIAIMLGRLRMSAEEAFWEYLECVKKVLSVLNVTKKSRAAALRQFIDDLVRRRRLGDWLIGPGRRWNSRGRCLVPIMPAKQTRELRRLRSYHSNNVKGFAAHIKIREAVQATTAVSFDLEPVRLPVPYNTSDYFADTATGCRNPADQLLEEAAYFFGTAKKFGCLISIGTRARPAKSTASSAQRDLIRVSECLEEPPGTLEHLIVDSEGHGCLHAKLGIYPNSYFRFNVDDFPSGAKGQEYTERAWKSITATYLADRNIFTRTLEAAKALVQEDAAHGLTLGHIFGIDDKDQTTFSTQSPRVLGDTHHFKLFTGRGDVLAKLDSCFSPRYTGSGLRREFHLYGVGGVGKTQTALQFASNCKDRFKYIFRIDGTNAFTTSHSYAKICQAHRPERGTTNEMKDEALHWIQTLSDEWLMIYDNCPQGRCFQPILPAVNRGNIIYISRFQGILPGLPADCTHEVKSLEKEDAVSLLWKIVNLDSNSLDPEELDAAHEIAAEVGNLPLAIESVAAYLKATKTRTSTYLQIFRNRRSRSGDRPALFIALDLSYDAIVSARRRGGEFGDQGWNAENALKVLSLFSFYHNEAIPTDVFDAAAKERTRFRADTKFPLYDAVENPLLEAWRLLEPEARNKFHWALHILQRAFLARLSLDARYLSLPLMVQAWARDRMDERDRCRQALVARVVLIESIKIEGIGSEDAWRLRSLTSHLDACLRHTSASTLDPEYQAYLDAKLGAFYKAERQFPNALEHLNRALRVWKVEEDYHSWKITWALKNLGDVYNDMGLVGEAELAYQEGITKVEARIDESGEDSNTSEEQKRDRGRGQHGSLGVPLPFVGQKQEKKSAQEGKAARDQEDEKRDTRVKRYEPVIEQILSEACWAFKDVRTSQSAQPSSKIARAQDASWFEIGTLTACVARLYMDQGKYSQARWWYLRAMQMVHKLSSGLPEWLYAEVWKDELERKSRKRRKFDPRYLDHWESSVADVNRMRDHFEKVFKSRVGQERWFNAHIGHASVLFDHENWEEAYAEYKRLVGAVQRYHGLSDRRTLYLLRQMAWCQVHRGLIEEADELARTAVRRAQASYGQRHVETSKCLQTLSYVVMWEELFHGPGSEFFELTRAAYDSLRFVFSEDHIFAKKLKDRLERLSNLKQCPIRLEPKTTNLAEREHVKVSPKKEAGALSSNNTPKPDHTTSDPPRTTLSNSYAAKSDAADSTEEAANGNLSQHLTHLIAKFETETEEERVAIMNAEYREWARRQFQEKIRKRKRREMLVRDAEEATGSQGGNFHMTDCGKDARIEPQPEPSESEGKGKGKEKETGGAQPLSPTVTETDQQETGSGTRGPSAPVTEIEKAQDGGGQPPPETTGEAEAPRPSPAAEAKRELEPILPSFVWRDFDDDDEAEEQPPDVLSSVEATMFSNLIDPIVRGFVECYEELPHK